VRIVPADRVLPEALRHLRRADPVLAGLMGAVGECRLKVYRRATPFAALAESIVHQQISGKAAASIFARLVALGGGTLEPGHIASASDEALRACGLSRQKAAAIRDLAEKAIDGLPTRRRLHGMDDEAAILALTTVRGVGRWTAEMFLMFRLGRPDVLPVDDYGIRKAVQRAYRLRALPKKDRLRRIAESWRPYRTVACWYLWRSLDAPPAPPLPKKRARA
jgi:3-methyladenine DNA glycosylase/8-oxoguanine DNA glycosylase